MKKIGLLFLGLSWANIYGQGNTAVLDTVEVLQGAGLTIQKESVHKSQDVIGSTIYDESYFQKNRTSNFFDALDMVNGVQAQNSCNVCNTGEIRVNGLDGPYTLILIDDMPIVSALSSVYGLSGIPMSVIESIEITKGPGDVRFPSEAMGGIINIKTKNNLIVPRLAVDVYGTSWGELNTDLATKFKLSSKLNTVLSLNYYNFKQKIDKNNDGFTDLALQDRLSVFNKWQLKRTHDRPASLALRYVYEDRWGGETDWTPRYRGSDIKYAESIFIHRMEGIGLYQLPFKEKIIAQASYNVHFQNAYYGNTLYDAVQHTAYTQLYWDKQWGASMKTLLGAAYRMTVYDDNTPATAAWDESNSPFVNYTPGLFGQVKWTPNHEHDALAGIRLDYDPNHNWVFSPRLAYKYHPHHNHNIRWSGGLGYRVVNLFTEDHAALSGARVVEIKEQLNPERSWNTILSYDAKWIAKPFFVTTDVNVFYNYFSNKIIPNYDVDPNKIIYENLDDYAVSGGVGLNTNWTFDIPVQINAGGTYMNVYSIQDGEKVQQIHAPKWSGNFMVTYSGIKDLSMNAGGQWYGPMRLPTVPDDYRPEFSPWYCVLNFQVNKKWKNVEVYGGVKNILNFTPKDPILRSWDPFDKYVNDPVNNPYNYTFDPSYTYASMQGRRVFIGVRYSLL